MANTLKGRYKPKNPNKYVGDKLPVYRSSWELKCFVFFDTDTRVIKWASEPVAIEYICQVRGTKHRYFPDFLVEMLSADGSTEVWMVEIKPESQSAPPKRGKKSAKRYLAEQQVWLVNQSKWLAAEKVCKERGWKFVVLGETALGIK